ncbi:hypothetical protein LSTR_LSTR007359 [Laodelphax striatellus]|uniref:Autophagy-related protein 2 n=1 Tax=Laodelphax striatellus TaxID=195883 RepID=A0A482XNJ3_LAOST|nr:hypothetical protein LSTR_LSTR007359 [Laodelphax striatellus]
MPWYLPFSDNIKKRACRYLLQRYLGQFLEEKLTLDQLTVNLYNGTGSVSNVVLDVQALNDLGEQSHLPFEFVDGYIDDMSVSIPWASLFSDSSFVQVSGLVLTVQPKEREQGASMFDSMWSSMVSTSSMQMAAECMEETKESDQSNPLEGIEKFAQAIDSILTRVKVKFTDALLRVEYMHKDSRTGVGLEIRVRNIDYCDEAGFNMDAANVPEGERVLQNSAFSASKFHCEGVTIYTDEFPADSRTMSRSLIKPNEDEMTGSQNDPKSLKNEPINPVLFGKLNGRQEVRIKLKQGENIQGPKVEFELNLGSLTVFSSPRQIHLLMELMAGFASPSTQDNSNVMCRPRSSKRMEQHDYERIEQQLMHLLNPDTKGPPRESKGLHTMQGWSTASVDDDSDEEFHPARGMRASGKNYSDSVFSEATSLDGSITSTVSSSTYMSKSQSDVYSAQSHTTHSRSKSKRKDMSPGDSDPNADVSTFHISLGNLSLVILHEDVMTSSPETGLLAPSSVAEMSKMAETFFEKIDQLAFSGYSNRDIDHINKVFVDACGVNHLRLLASPVIIEGDEKTSPSSKLLSAVITAASVELLECLIEKTAAQVVSNVEYVELLKFMRPNGREGDPQPVTAFSSQPDIWFHLKRIEKTTRTNHPRIPHTEINVTIQQCWLEVDISIVDRITAILNPRSLCKPSKRKANSGLSNSLSNEQSSIYHSTVESQVCQDSKTELKIKSPYAVIKLRIPIADLRPISDFSRPPWWKRSVRKDIFIFNLTDVLFNTVKDSRNPVDQYSLQCKEIKAFFQEGDNSRPTQFAQASVLDSNSNVPGVGEKPSLPRITLTFNPVQKPSELEDVEDNDEESLPPMSHSIVIETPLKEPSPFSSKRIIHESDTPHNVECEGEELIIPGNKEEISEFTEIASSNTITKLEITLPHLNVHFPSKHLYEVIYNRFNSDLLLWQPVAPREPSCDLGQSDILPSLYHDACFTQCKSGTQYESDSDSDNDETNYNVWDHNKQKKTSKPNRKAQNRITISLNVGLGKLNAFTNIKDVTGHGEIEIRCKEVNLFLVGGYQNLTHNSYICLQINHAELLHNGETCSDDQDGLSRLLSEFKAPPASHLRPTLYKTDNGAVVSANASPVGLGSAVSKDMITLAIWSHVKDTKVKVVRVACGIRGTTLRHNVTQSKHNWFNQLLDFFGVMDYPVPGHHPMQVITELHQHLWDCAIDYRPLNLSLRSMVTLGNLSISSNMAAKTSSSALRFIAEDAALFLSDKLHNNVDLRTDYVCVLDFGLFELSLRLSDSPRVDLRASNNVVHIRTCSDSARYLAQLITYFACDGDLAEEELAASSTEETFNQSVDDEKCDSLSESAVQLVNNLMEDAMQDIHGNNGSGSGNENNANGVQVFFFPDERGVGGGIARADEESGGGEPAWSPGLDSKDSDSSDSMKDWNIVDSEALAGSGIIPPNGVPIVRHLTGATVRIVDNHFSKPTHKSDLLKAPASFPPAILRYCLREMTLVWHMYGGQDFGSEQAKKHVTIAERDRTSDSARRNSAHGTNVAFSSSRPQEVNFNSDSQGHQRYSPHRNSLHGIHDYGHRTTPKLCNIPTRWQDRGGKGRQHDVLMELQLNKVRFQYDVFSKNAETASRQVLLIQEFEIRDLLASSEMNKFLYQYSSIDCPKQSSANMVRIRALHIRPEPAVDVQECKMKVSLLPLRLNIDQDALLFLVTFVNEISGTNRNEECNVVAVRSPRSSQPPVMGMEPSKSPIHQSQSNEKLNSTKSAVSSPIFFREFNFTPEVRIRLDYQGKRVDMTHGPWAGLLMGLGQLSNSEIRLIRLNHQTGLLGIEKLISYVLTEWLQDIKKNQLPAILGGVGPINSLVQLAQGIRDLFWLPIEQYQKDGRIVRGLQRGANSFTTSTAMAALEITTRIVQAIQYVAETAFDVVSPGPSVRSSKHVKRNRYNQPADIREGVSAAISLVKEGLGETAQTLMRVASAEHETKGAVGAVGGVLRQLPPTVVAPIILASAATDKVLGGVRGQLVPDARKEHRQKWRTKDGQ